MRGGGGNWRTERTLTRLAGAPWALVLAAAVVRCAGGAGEQVPVQGQKRVGVVEDAGPRSRLMPDAQVLDTGTDAPPDGSVVCEAVYAPSLANISTALPLNGAQLSASNAHLCIARDCFDIPLPSPAKGPPRNFGPWLAQEFIGRLHVRAQARLIAPQRVGLDISVDLDSRSDLTVDGTRYELSISDPNRRTLLHVTRLARYDVDTNACRTVRTFRMSLSAYSLSGMQCTGKDCPFYDPFELRLPLRDPPPSLDGAKLTVCRNQLCTSDTMRVVAGDHGAFHGETVASGGTDGYVALSWSLFSKGGRVALLVLDDAPSFARAADDRYRVLLHKRGEAAPRTLFDRRIHYSASYPNGKQCDAVPCRHACVDLCQPGHCPGHIPHSGRFWRSQIPGCLPPSITQQQPDAGVGEESP